MGMDNSGYVDSAYLDMTAQMLATAKRRTYELMEVTTGQRVLDVGCGPASDTISLARLVGDTGQVRGADYDPEMVEEANARVVAEGLDDRVLHEHADATALPFDDDYFDGSRSERLFQHLPDPSAGLAEMVRVTGPGGRIVVLDADYGSLSVGSLFPDVERRLAEHVRSMVNSPFAGRWLYRSFKAANLDDVSVEVLPVVFTDLEVFSVATRFDRAEREAAEAGLVTDDELRRFRADLEQAARIGGFFATGQLVLVSGRKPVVTTGV